MASQQDRGAPGTGAGAPTTGIGTGLAPQGLCVLVTRPIAQADEAVRELQAAGLAAVALPLIDIVPDPAADAALASAWARLDQIDFVMFVSAAAVARFFAEAVAATPVATSGLPPATSAAPAAAPAVAAPAASSMGSTATPAASTRRWPAGTRAGATGPGTVAALQRAGVPAASIDAPAATSPRFDSEALWAGLGARDWRGRRALIVRGEGGRDWLAETLRAAGAEVEAITLYRREVPHWSAAQWAACEQAWAEPLRHWWHLSSSQAIDHLVAMAAARPRLAAAPWPALQALASHPRIAAHARACGFGRVHEVAPGMPAVIDALTGPTARRPPAAT